MTILRLPRQPTADRAACAALQALADHYATQHGDTPQLQTARRTALLAEIDATWGDTTSRIAWNQALTAALRDAA